MPAYRGYTIDSLRKLEFLDAIPISADDKHKYKGLAKRKGLHEDISVATIKFNLIATYLYTHILDGYVMGT